MIIQHNMPAINAHRQMGINTNNIAKSLEKLSSGYRINRAGDDAAGLAISEKMRGQISGLNQATRNAQDGISLIQTAEGNLQETHAILQRMRELAVQSANGTYDNSTDRFNIDKEVTALKSEIDRIASSAEFNGRKLLDGTMAGAEKPGHGVLKVGDKVPAGAELKGLKDASLTAAKQLGIEFNGKPVNVTIIANGQTGTSGSTAAPQSATAEWDASGNLTLTLKGGDAGSATTSAKDFTAAQINDAITNAKGTAPAGVKVSAKKTIQVATDNEISTADTTNGAFAKGTAPKLEIEAIADNTEITAGIIERVNGVPGDKINATDPQGQLVLQIGANGVEDQRVSLEVQDMSSSGLKATINGTETSVNDISVATRKTANDAIDVIDTAINTVSSTRADLGALQNRLEHTINNLGVYNENLTAAESRIRDVDMAKEMMSFTKNQILAQASQAMLAQANSLPQGVLQLLQ